MKKVTLMVVGLVALVAMATQSFADVQNIRLSGDVRIRGYYFNYGDNDNIGHADGSLVAQRTRVTVEADLEDHVLVVVTLKAEGLWGRELGYQYDGPYSGISGSASQSAGAGLRTWGDPVNNTWAVGINEAYVQLNEMFFNPATLKIGRQYLNYGRGLIISSVEGEYNFDAVRLVLDFYPLTVDLVGAMLVDSQRFSPIDERYNGRSLLLFANARYEMADSLVKDIEGYFGWITQDADRALISSPASPYLPHFGGASPWIVGLRADLNLTKTLQMWAEGAYEGGEQGFIDSSSHKISGWLVNVGAQLSLADTQMSPVINASYTFASGDSTFKNGDTQGYFHPWFDYSSTYNGYMLKPVLSNIHIFNLGATVKPAKNCSVGVQGYYYLKADKDGVNFTNPNLDNGFGTVMPATDKSDIGWGIDLSVGYDYSKDVRMGLIYGVFLPGTAVRDTGFDQTSYGLRGEVNVKF